MDFGTKESLKTINRMGRGRSITLTILVMWVIIRMGKKMEWGTLNG